MQLNIIHHTIDEKISTTVFFQYHVKQKQVKELLQNEIKEYNNKQLQQTYRYILIKNS